MEGHSPGEPFEEEGVWLSLKVLTLQMEIQREKNRVVELTNETKKFNELKKVIIIILCTVTISWSCDSHVMIM